MLIAQVKFGQTHAVTALGDVFKGKQVIDLGCSPGIEITNENRARYKLLEVTGDHVVCVTCRRNTGLDKDEEENAD